MDDEDRQDMISIYLYDVQNHKKSNFFKLVAGQSDKIAVVLFSRRVELPD